MIVDNSRKNGEKSKRRVAQPGLAHHFGVVGAAGSNPVTPTLLFLI